MAKKQSSAKSTARKSIPAKKQAPTKEVAPIKKLAQKRADVHLHASAGVEGEARKKRGGGTEDPGYSLARHVPKK